MVPGGGEGLGVAMYRGLKAAAQLAPDVIVAVDGDGQADAAAEIRRFLAPSSATKRILSSGHAFLIKASLSIRIVGSTALAPAFCRLFSERRRVCR